MQPSEPATTAAALELRVEQMQVLEGMLRERIRRLEAQGLRALEARSRMVAENRRYRRHIDEYRRHRRGGGRVLAETQTLDPTLHDDDDDDDDPAIDKGSLEQDDYWSVLVCRPTGSTTRPSEDKEEENNQEDDQSFVESEVGSYDEPVKQPKSGAAAAGGKGTQKRQAYKVQDTANFYVYRCPVQGCHHEFGFNKKTRPPLNPDGTVSDDSFWPFAKFHNQTASVRAHMRRFHANIRQTNWPAGFAITRRRTKMATSTTESQKATAAAAKPDTPRGEFDPWPSSRAWSLGSGKKQKTTTETRTKHTGKRSRQSKNREPRAVKKPAPTPAPTAKTLVSENIPIVATALSQYPGVAAETKGESASAQQSPQKSPQKDVSNAQNVSSPGENSAITESSLGTLVI